MAKEAKLGPWSVGANNRLPPYDLPKDQYGRTIALRSAVNTDIDSAGNVRRRDGYAKASTGLGTKLNPDYAEGVPIGDVPCKIPRHFRGRDYAVGRMATNTLYFTDAYSEEVEVEEFNQIAFPDPIAVFEPVKGGLWVVTTAHTYFLAGTGPEDFSQTEVLPYGAVPGTGVRVPNSDDIVWYSTRGAVVGTSAGEAKNIQEKHFAAPSATAGTATIVESRGVRKYIVSLKDPTPSPLAFS